MKRKKTAAVDTAAGRLAVSYWPAADGLIEWADPYRKQIADTVGPLAKQARKSGARAAHDALERVTPVLDDAWERVTPAVESAREKVQHDLMPRLNHALAEAADHPVAIEAARRGRATAAALRGEVEVAEPKKKRGRKVLGVLAIIAAVGGAAYAVKKYLDSRDAEWEAPAPSTYGGSNTAKRADTSPWAATTDKVTSTPAPSAVATPATPTAPEPAAKPAEKPTEKVTEKPEAAAEATTDESASDERNYGPGSYVGNKPPKGFEIKGNERSMKFHTPDSPAYDRTISDVWFNSAEVAEKNGFSRAQR